MDKAASIQKDILWNHPKCRVHTIWIVIYDYLLLIIAKKHYMLNPSLHLISNSIGQVLFKKGDIKDIFNQTDFTASVPESDGPRQLTL